jgi:hypothetical protein
LSSVLSTETADAKLVDETLTDALSVDEIGSNSNPEDDVVVVVDVVVFDED